MTVTKILTILLLSFAVLISIGGGLVYYFADDLVEVGPARGLTVANEKPLIKVSWLNIPGVRVSRVMLTLDGRKTELQAPKSGTAFAYRPQKPLAQGDHEVAVEVTYSLGLRRRVEADWRFKVDTEPPKIGLAGGDSFLVSAVETAAVALKSEPGVAISAVLNEKDVGRRETDKRGEAVIKLRGLEKDNVLKLAARDAVGNLRTLMIPIKKDETTPGIESFWPGEGELVREEAPKIEVGFVPQETGLRRIEMTIDDTITIEQPGDESNRIAYVGHLPDGEHKVKVKAVDFAGRSVSKEWDFSTDSRRIVINRGQRRLYYYENGKVARTFGVAVGMPQYPTPGGTWQVVNKQVNPSWINPGSDWAKDMPKVIPPSWSNPLGVRALALNARNILIHGTSKYGSIGTAASHGCIRMRNSDIVNFFPTVGVGTPVEIL